MKITREKACQRLHHRISTPLMVNVAGDDYSALDWSLGGFRLTGWNHRDNIDVGSRVPCRFELPFQGFNIAFDVESEIVRIDENTHEVAQKFVELDDRQTELLEHFVEQLVRGSMIPVQDTILRIDSPVTPVSTKPDPSPLEQVPVKRLPLQVMAMSLVYLSMGILLFLLVSITVYENFLSLKVSTAITSTPVEPLMSHADGHIKRVSVAVDEFVGEGTTLLHIESPSVNRKIEGAKIFIEQKKIELEEKRKKYALAIDTTGGPASKESRTYEIEVDMVQQEVTLAMQNLLALYDYEQSLMIDSPSHGRMVRLFRERGSQVKKGETIGVFERDQVPTVHAYVTADEARDIDLNLPATIRMLNLDKQWFGRVINIKPDKTYISERRIGYIPNNIEGRDVLVEIEMNIHSSGIDVDRIHSGMPVEVLFPSTPVSKIVHKYFYSEDDVLVGKPDTNTWSI